MKGWQAHDRGDLPTACRYLSDLWGRVDRLPMPLCSLDTGLAYAESLAWSGDHRRALEVAEFVLDDSEKRIKKGQYREDDYMVASARDLAASMLVTPAEAGQASANMNRALELAEKNVGYFPRDGLFRTTLGLVQCRAGRYHGAIATLSKANELDEGRRFAPRGFILAMAYWQRGEKETARETFRQSVAWMDRERPGHPELLRARNEAARLLGVPDHPQDQGFPTDPFVRDSEAQDHGDSSRR